MTFLQQIFSKRPLGIQALLAVIATLVVLTLMLGTMVYGRISLLQNGSQIVLKTAPVDPRDLLRGYFVRLRYDISNLKLKELSGWNKDRHIPINQNGFSRHQKVYVELHRQSDGFWSPHWVHRTMPDKADDSVYIRGRVRSYSCLSQKIDISHCTLNLRFGIEKFFTEKKRAKKLEDFGRQVTPEITKLRKQIRLLQKSYRQPWEKRSKAQRRAAKERPANLGRMRTKLAKLVEQNRLEMANRFAVIARVDKQSGEAAISGLQLDGKRIYDERLF